MSSSMCVRLDGDSMRTTLRKVSRRQASMQVKGVGRWGETTTRTEPKQVAWIPDPSARIGKGTVRKNVSYRVRKGAKRAWHSVMQGVTCNSIVFVGQRSSSRKQQMNSLGGQTVSRTDC